MKYIHVVIVITFVLTACSGENSSTRLLITGSSTAAPLVNAIAQRFEKNHRGYRIDVQTGGSTRGIMDPVRGLSHIGMSSRNLLDNEVPARQVFPLAMDGVGFVLHRNNPVDAVNKSRLRDIYTGKITRWSQLGGREEPIVVVNRAQGRSELSLVTRYLGIKSSQIKAHIVSGENQHALKTVLNNENAIVYMSIGSAEFEIQKGAALKMMVLEGVAANSNTVAAGRYPLKRPLILVTKKNPEQDVRRFIEYARSENVFDLIKVHSFVPPKP